MKKDTPLNIANNFEKIGDMIQIKDRFLYRSALGVIFGTMALILYVTFLMLYPYKTIEFKEFAITTPVVRAGENFTNRGHHIKYTDKPCLITWQLLSKDFSYYYPTFYSNVPPGEMKMTVKKEVPLFTPPGEYIIRNIPVYRMNPLREVTVTKDSNSFKIIAPKSKGEGE